MNSDFSQLSAAEEAKRNRHISAQQKWKLMQQPLDWTDILPTGQRNTEEACLREQERLLAGLAAWRSTQSS